jgi:hypothetical protein
MSSQAWIDYRRFRSLQVNDDSARRPYEWAKRQLAQQYPHNRRAYTQAKAVVIHELLDAPEPVPGPQTG